MFNKILLLLIICNINSIVCEELYSTNKQLINQIVTKNEPNPYVLITSTLLAILFT
jgi:hypothetical protein